VLPSPWSVPFDPLLIAALVVIAATAGLSAAAGGEDRSRWRRASGPAAAVVLAAAWVSPLQTLAAHYLLTAHMVQATLVMGLVAPLLLLGLPHRLPWRVPAALLRACRWLVHPVSGMVAINAAFIAWHIPAVYDLALRNPSIYAAQQVSLLVASLLFWWPIVVPLGDRRVLSRWATLGYILVATIPQTLAGITVAMTKHAIYSGYAIAPRVTGLGVMTDQQVAGASTALVSKVALFTAFAIILMHLLSEPASEGEDDGGGGGGRRPGTDTPSPQPSGSVPWLADINAGRTVPEPAPPRPRIRVPAAPGSGRG
jgi:cytochrome c oxidase assembly factor CtaG